MTPVHSEIDESDVSTSRTPIFFKTPKAETTATDDEASYLAPSGRIRSYSTNSDIAFAQRNKADFGGSGSSEHDTREKVV